ncbi:hypothetical protein FDB30_03835 [Clostridium botulinum]|nr:tail fiber protein [Clostridium botulinum]NFG36815.1 hypothetical protein [Clostridium botulinum]NFN27387.1 hypothetical protein [Clostridium botulinum]NFO00016.1 hypothetical protein [Clostridium botulinum]NFO49698.1 hypothetical protein [Clostridium botulinum]
MKDIANKVDNIKIADGTTTTKGIVKLNNATNSISQTEAATPLAVKLVMDRANEAFTGADNYKKGIAGVVGNPVTGTQNKDEAVNSIQGIKNNAASTLKSKNVDASGNEALASLVSKIGNISIAGMGGKKCVVGSTPVVFSEGNHYWRTDITITGFNFIPTHIFSVLISNFESNSNIALSMSIFYNNYFIFNRNGSYSGGTITGSVIVPSSSNYVEYNRAVMPFYFPKEYNGNYTLQWLVVGD